MKTSEEMRDYPVADMIKEDADWLQKKVDEVAALEADNARLREAWTTMLGDCYCGEGFTARGMHSTTCAVYHAVSYAPDDALEAKD